MTGATGTHDHVWLTTAAAKEVLPAVMSRAIAAVGTEP